MKTIRMEAFPAVVSLIAAVAILALPPQAYPAETTAVAVTSTNAVAISGTDGIPDGCQAIVTVHSQTEADAAIQIIAGGGWLPEWGPKPDVLLCVVAILVVVVGGYMVYKLVEFCQAHFPPPPPPAPISTNSLSTNSVTSITSLAPLVAGPNAVAVGDTNIYVAFIPVNSAAGMFPPGAPLDGLVPINVAFGAGNDGAVTMTDASPMAESDLVTPSQFLDALRTSYGLAGLPPDPRQMAATPYYSCNGIATSNSPISWTNGRVSVAYASAPPATQVVLQRSYDLVTWTPVCTNALIPGHSIGVTAYEPGSAVQTFYRTVVVKP